jgi:hypothetical protein
LAAIPPTAGPQDRAGCDSVHGHAFGGDIAREAAR